MVVIFVEVKKVYFAIHMCDNSGTHILQLFLQPNSTSGGGKIKNILISNTSRKKKNDVSLSVV